MVLSCFCLLGLIKSYKNTKFNIIIFRDNVQWDEEQEKAAKEKVEQNSEVTLSEDRLKDLDINADKHWDAFYDIHQNR